MLRQMGASALIFFAIIQSAAADPGDSQAGVLALRNGQVLRGVIVLLGDRYQVTLPGGGEIRIARSAVEMQCRDMAEAYALKSQAAARGSINEQLDLAEWCLRHEQFSNAAEQLTLAMRREPRHPRVLAIERRLKSIGTTPAEIDTSAAPTSLRISQESLEQEMRELPTGSLETFTSTVQPLIINRCAANGCHGSATPSAFRLFQPGNGQTLTRRFTQRNLHATLGLIDKEKPSDSKLLTVIRDAHGTAPKAIFTDREEANYKQLERWVQQVTRPKPTGPASLTERPTSLLQTTNGPKSFPSLPNDEASTKDDEAPPASTSDSAAGESEKKRKIVRGASQREFVPRDPFDPEIFNRRYFGGQSKPDDGKKELP